MKISLILYVLLTSIMVYGQDPRLDSLYKLYQQQQYEEVIQKSQTLLTDETLKLDLNLLLGRTYTDKGDYKDAIPFLEYTVQNDTENSWRKAWALGYLGTSYFMLQEYNSSKAALEECLNLNATRNVNNYAGKRMVHYGFNNFYNDWHVEESEHFRFHFQNMSGDEIKAFIQTHEAAYQEINRFFESNLPRKIDFFVWNSRDDAKRILRADLGFSNPSSCLIHAYFKQTKGHEMTHVISNYTSPVTYKTGLINEGTAVCFDLSNQDKSEQVASWLKSHQQSIDMAAIWQNWNNFPEELTYPLAGLFVKELIDTFGREKFMAFFANQSYENAKLVFGDGLDSVIQEFEARWNIDS